MKPISKYIIFSLLAIIVGLLLLVDADRSINQELTAQRDSLLNQSKRLEIQQEILSAHVFDLEERNAAQDLVIQSREQEIVRTQKASNEIRKKYESLKTLRFTSNAQRDSIRAVLYPPGHHF